jgi:type II secretory pathway pseudopilin PulG
LELLIVVAIILIIASIAIPNFIRSRQLANENSTVGNLRTISNAEATYQTSTGGYFGTIAHLVSEKLLDNRFGTGRVGGYDYAIVTDGFDYTATATPVGRNDGRYGFFMNGQGVVHYSTVATLAPAGQAGNPVN